MDKLRKWLLKQNTTQRELAKLLGVSDATVSMMLNGGRGITKEMMESIYTITKGYVEPNDICTLKRK